MQILVGEDLVGRFGRLLAASPEIIGFPVPADPTADKKKKYDAEKPCFSQMPAAQRVRKTRSTLRQKVHLTLSGR